MNIDLSGKNALVTGSTSGIGFAIAKGSRGSGAEVIVNGRSQANVDKAAAAIEKALPNAKTARHCCGRVDREGLRPAGRDVPAVDILINNAGIFEPKDFFETTDEEWKRFFDVNVLSGVRLSRAYMKGMLQRNWGRIVFISSRIRPADSAGDDPLRRHQDGAARPLARACGADRRHRRHRQFRAAGADHVGRRAGFRRGACKTVRQEQQRRPRPRSSASIARPR